MYNLQMVGGIFGAVGIGSEDPYGKVDADDLTTALGDIFAHAQKFLEQLGRLASGRANPDEGDDYEFLPGQVRLAIPPSMSSPT